MAHEEPEDFGDRLFTAMLVLQGTSREKISETELGRRVAALLEREKPFSQTAVSGWLDGAFPEVVTVGAIAEVCGVDPGWLAFGEKSKAEPPIAAPVRAKRAARRRKEKRA